MEKLFVSVLNMSITGSYVILFILLVRLLLRSAPKKYSYALWAAVGFRLCCPVSFRTVFSLFSLKPFDMAAAQPASGGLTYVPADIGSQQIPQISTGIPAANSILNPVLPDPTGYSSPLAQLQAAAALVWLVGMAAMLGYALWSRHRLDRSLATATRLEEDVWQSESVRSPFILGLLRPRIYIPYGLEPQALEYVLRHERYHLRRMDHGVRLFAFGLLTVHWFNPLCWLAFALMSRDMELRCDEAVLSGAVDKAAYSTLLLSFGANRRMPLPGPLAFGETGVARRIKSALAWKKPARWMAALALACCLVTLALCAADPRTGLLAGEEIDYALCGDTQVAEDDLQDLLELINGSGYSRYSTGQAYRAETDTLVALYGADGTVWTLHYWYCSGFSWDLRHLGEDDYYTILSRLDADGNPVSAWKLEYDFDDLFVYWKKIALNGVQEPVQLLQKYPAFFMTTGYKGYEVYVRDNGYTLMAGTNRIKTREEVETQPVASFEEIMAILEILGASEEQISFYRFGDSGMEGVTREQIDPRFDLDYCIRQALLANAPTGRYDLTVADYHIFDQKTETVGDTTRVTVWLWAMDLSWRYTLEEGGENTGGSSYPAVVTLLQDAAGRYSQIGFAVPRDGSYHDNDIRAMFPRELWDRVFGFDTAGLHDRCWALLSQSKPAALEQKITALFAKVASGPLYASDPGSYIAEHPEEWSELLHYGDATFTWCCRRFLQGGQNGLQGHLYWAAVNQLIGGEAVKSVAGTGQENFDIWYRHVQMIRDKNGMEFLAKYYPWSYRLLQIADA